jgi:hypothetical protein
MCFYGVCPYYRVITIPRANAGQRTVRLSKITPGTIHKQSLL